VCAKLQLGHAEQELTSGESVRNAEVNLIQELASSTDLTRSSFVVIKLLLDPEESNKYARAIRFQNWLLDGACLLLERQERIAV
jgi:hypothetical protein